MKELPKDLPKVGQGIMRFDNIYSKEAILKYQKIIDHMMEQGCNYFEAATFYLDHHCEDLLRHFLRKYPRESYYLADKMDPREFHRKNISMSNEQFFLDFFNAQLSKMNTEYFDFYLFQALDRTCKNYLTDQKIFDTINILKEQNKIHYVGFSFHDTPEYLDYYLSLYDWDFIQIQFNYYNYYNGISKKLYDLATSKNIPVFVMGSTQGGLLSNLPNKAYKYSKNFNYDSEIAFNFLKKFDNVKLVLNGANTLKQTQNNISFWKKPIIDFNEEQEIVKIINNEKYILCTECGYCETVCPKKINIKKTFSLYNKIINNNNEKDKNDYMLLQKDERGIFNCIQCGQCKNRCPQHLPVNDLITFLTFNFRA